MKSRGKLAEITERRRNRSTDFGTRSQRRKCKEKSISRPREREEGMVAIRTPSPPAVKVNYGDKDAARRSAPFAFENDPGVILRSPPSPRKSTPISLFIFAKGSPTALAAIRFPFFA